MSNRIEREYAVLADRLDALDQDIRHARNVSRASARAPARARTTPHGTPALLPDGTRVLVRPIEPADAQQLRAGFDQLGAASRYQRFLAPVAYLTDRQLDYLTRIDHEMHEALVAVDAVTGEGIGVARFVRDARDPARADVAIVVADRWHSRGVGTLLADQLASSGRGTWSHVVHSADRRPAIAQVDRLVERVGQGFRERDDGGTILLTATAQERTRPVPELVDPLPRREGTAPPCAARTTTDPPPRFPAATVALSPDSARRTRPDTRRNATEGGAMSQYMETAEDKFELVVGGTIFTIVAALTAVVMAIGLGAIEAVDRLRHRS